MEDGAILICFLFFMLILGAITGTVAHFKGRNVLGWSALGFFCGLAGLLGIVPVIVIACLPNLNEQAARDAHVAEENRRLREQLRQERIKSESFRQHTAARLDAHDQHLGLDTRTAGPALGAGANSAGLLGAGGQDVSDAARWYYGLRGQTLGPVKASEIMALLRRQVISRDTLVWAEDMADWRPAGQVPALDPRTAAPAPRPAFADIGTPRWHYSVLGQSTGPVTTAQIVSLIRQQVINGDTLVWSEGYADWQPAGRVAEFAMQFA